MTEVRWRSHLSHLHDLLRPGGYIELVEQDVLPSCTGPCTSHLMQKVEQAWCARGMNVWRAAHLAELLEEVGFEAVRRLDVKVPIHHWAGGQGSTIGQLSDATFILAHKALVEGSVRESMARHARVMAKRPLEGMLAEACVGLSTLAGTSDAPVSEPMTENEFNALVQTAREELAVNRTYVTLHVYWACKRH
ncbi:hypothetical protein THASP1DRAFT_33327 [Thamnocephalis sphaerospora]|uniref:Methyltransferase type 11 domain-containing protein n=1 Tax=Thamnocephalis sphaerospora TaxID=78915 RepID=A0A4P9XGV1_9FUNG|nr:hypothetical protein THASP1DRAFT_33327 [Thamnocephalis sphaerospora]|eukprot:RKP04862.1 hypothetical protein THASP1DRAFT_33327 [Thamnocephalis sphaerospora]